MFGKCVDEEIFINDSTIFLATNHITMRYSQTGLKCTLHSSSYGCLFLSLIKKNITHPSKVLIIKIPVRKRTHGQQCGD